MIFVTILYAKYLNTERFVEAVRWTFCAIQPVKPTIQHNPLNLNSYNSYHLHAKTVPGTFGLLTPSSLHGTKRGQGSLDLQDL